MIEQPTRKPRILCPIDGTPCRPSCGIFAFIGENSGGCAPKVLCDISGAILRELKEINKKLGEK